MKLSHFRLQSWLISDKKKGRTSSGIRGLHFIDPFGCVVRLGELLYKTLGRRSIDDFILELLPVSHPHLVLSFLISHSGRTPPLHEFGEVIQGGTISAHHRT
jgi:hypothetical protein